MKQFDDNFELKANYDFSKGVRDRFYKPTKISTLFKTQKDKLLFNKVG